MPFREEAHNKLEEYLELLNQRERKEFLELATTWGNISGTLDSQIRRLSELENLSENQLFQLNLYRKFLEDSRVVINTYSEIAEGIITNEQEVFAELGLKSAQDLIGVNFANKLNFEDVKFMVGNTQEGTPLFDLLNESYPETVDRITNTLTSSMALGRGPIETARLLKNDMDGNLNRALRIARTEQINVFREAQTKQYKDSGIVKSKDWVGVADERLCPICASGISNSPYDLDEVMNTHPNCRCGWSPNLTDVPKLKEEDNRIEFFSEGGEQRVRIPDMNLSEQIQVGRGLAQTFAENRAAADVLIGGLERQVTQSGRSSRRFRTKFFPKNLTLSKQLKDMVNIAARFNSNFTDDIINIARANNATNLTLDFFKAVKSLTNDTAKYFLTRSIENDWTLEKLKEEVKKYKTRKRNR